MKRYMKNHSVKNQPVMRQLLSLALAASLALPLPALAASVALATSPLASSTTTAVKPNLLFVLDNSGSMDWDHMPDDASDGGSAVTWVYGYYGLRSSQCNEVYYDPAITYTPPVKADGTSYPNATFTAAWINGFSTGAGTVNLDTGYKASQSLMGDSINLSAYYYTYSGAQTTAALKNYNSTTNAFFKECNSSVNASTGSMPPVRDVAALTGASAPGTGVFTKHRLATTETTTITVTGSASVATPVTSITVNMVELLNAATAGSTSSSTVAANIATQINARTAVSGFSASSSSGTVTITGPTSAANYTPVIAYAGTFVLTPNVFPDTTAANLTNFANWYSYYRTRMLMMKTAAGAAFSSLGSNYRVGLMKISSSTPVVYMGTFTDSASAPVSTQRTDWYNALYGMATSGSTPLRTALSSAGRYFAHKLGGTDPLQYSCQQNFAIMSTDGYWNSGDGYMMDGTTLMDNEDGTAARPMYDGATASNTVTITYTRNQYSTTSTGCSGGKKKLKTQPQTGSCAVAFAGATPTGFETCTPAAASWTNTGTATTGSCLSTVTLPTPNPGVATETGRTISPPTGGSSNSLADVAMYYYMTDLRTTTLGNCTGAISGEDVCTNNVFISGTDNNTQQHMTTFTLGLGASGWMQYSPSYLSDGTGDYAAVKLGSTASATECAWQTAGTVCNWPIPGMDASSNGYIANIDDLWHAAVNGHGAYFSATNPSSLSIGLSNALSGINAKKGSAAAAATSTLNPVAGNNFAYVASYITMKWQGNLEARGINIDTGVVNENATWCAENVVASTCVAPASVVSETTGSATTYYCVTPNSVICNGGSMVGTDCYVPVATSCTGTMGSRVSDAADTRAIKTPNAAGTTLVEFDASYAAANPTNFSATHISALTQWSTLTAAQQTAAAGTNLINYLRGQYGHEDRVTNAVTDRLYRARDAVLGDTLESQPAYLGPPIFSYPYPGYSEFAAAYANRAGTVYLGANDGMMHAFAADTGVERWAYVPSMVVPNMWKLADYSYSTLHANYVNGSPVTTDVCVANCNNAYSILTPFSNPVWKTILVSGLNGGGRGYFALDITDPNTPTLLWEFTTSSGTGIRQDDDLGYSYGKPVVTRKVDGTWVVVVTSGYNNTSPGTGRGFLYVLDAATGAIISKIATGVGNTTTPSGLAKIAVWNSDIGGNTAGYVYGGDLQGNLWRFDINSTVPATIGTGDVIKFASLYSDAAGTNPQPITTAPTLGEIAGKRVVFVATGKYLETGDLSTTQKQTQYAIKDDDSGATLVNPRNTLVNQTLGTSAGGAQRVVTSSNTVNFYTGRGWYVDFPDTGERANIDSLLVSGVLITPTIVPSNTACSPGGYGWLNFFDYKTGGSFDMNTLLVSLKYDSPIVGISVSYIGGEGKLGVSTLDDGTPKQPSGFGLPPPQVTFQGKRTIWREFTP